MCRNTKTATLKIESRSKSDPVDLPKKIKYIQDHEDRRYRGAQKIESETKSRCSRSTCKNETLSDRSSSSPMSEINKTTYRPNHMVVMFADVGKVGNETPPCSDVGGILS